ncbi:acyl-CoA dehydrogenase [Legionella impletisoli]|uniref:Acyl-coenzyme A dehydrogenase n=1 Tax=Legionella impletisoli TaxID=343510 RepID=A0A917N823_9GAMM|nr:acyl-CoA dehydrogenase [Legionella impletisoli]GGI75658.1 acyl-CoA dehydrogenase [Legionella impletisoli]
MLNCLMLIALIGAAGFLFVKQASLTVWTISYGLVALLLSQYASFGVFVSIPIWSLFTLMVLASIKPLRRKYLSHLLFDKVREAMPTMSRTEREALEAGTIGWEGELFSGSPDFKHLRDIPPATLSNEEQAFLDGSVNQLCRMIDEWDITHKRADLPPELWEFIKTKGFFGMIIPKSYGGLGFSAVGVMSVLVKLYARSITVASTVAVPNSLGPAELLLKYGTKEQQDYYLPRLADGREIPCFALTGPNAGSDAASIPDTGIVCTQQINGEEVVGIRLNWNKRYITLAPVATVIGLAFRLFDPDHILGDKVDIGISCALIPADHPGVVKGRRHFPLNTPFMNGPTQGKDVFVPIDYLIGGAKMAGHGWRMLMECLSAGRAISLPSSAVGAAQAVSLVTGAYARVRKQFNQPIGRFEGIEEALARIAGKTYMIDAALSATASAINKGQKSAVAGAILKYHTTEWARQIGIDSMDIHAGKGICLGPKNYLGRGYEGAPISITVEGANILTRSLIIFGQGAIRCHPYVLKEMESVRENNLAEFDEALWSHAAFFMGNFVKSITFSLTDGRLTAAPNGYTKRYYQLVHRYSANLAFLADFSMIALGAKLKRKEKISARLGDVLSYLYITSGVLHRFYRDGEPASDKPLVDWCCQYLFYQIEEAIHGVIVNMPMRWARVLLRIILQPIGRQRALPSDKLGQKLARILLSPNESRERLTRLVFHESLPNCPLGQVEEAFQKLCSVEELEKKLSCAVKEKSLSALAAFDQITEAEEQGILTSEEAANLRDAETARQQAIAVDDFTTEELALGDRNKPTKKNKMLEALGIEA